MFDIDKSAVTPATTSVEVTIPSIAKPRPAPAISALVDMPKLQPFTLPVSELAELALSSGLVWVNSDADKVATVQSAFAAEPKPVHQLRNRPSPKPQDDRPLILVETKRDLRNITLPFESSNSV